MAIDPSTAYAGQIITDDPGWPYGKARNEIIDGDGTGTPLEADWVADLFGFQQALLDAASITPSGDPDKVGDSQYLDALQALFPAIGRMATAEAEIDALEASRVTGPASATDNAIARYDGITGKLVQSSGIGIDDSARLTLAAPVTETIKVPLPEGTPEGGFALSSGGTHWVVTSPAGNASVYFGISKYLPRRGRLTHVRAWVGPGTTGTTSVQAFRVALDGFQEPDAISIWGDSSSGTGRQQLDATGSAHTIDLAANQYVVRVQTNGLALKEVLEIELEWQKDGID